MSNRPIFVWQDDASRSARIAAEPSFAATEIRKAAISGDAGAQLTWGLMLLDGHGTAQDLGAALHWFQLAARSGNRDAINLLGRCYELGWGTTTNVHLAAQCYRGAAEQGHAWAQFNLACLMLRNDDIPGDLDEALALLVRSARQGNPKAMNMIGRCCEEGWRGIAKPAAARRWYARAARGGCFRGAFHTARHLMIAGDVDGATTWLRRSLERAPADFCDELGQMFIAHPDERLRAISALAFEQARRAPSQPFAEGLSSAIVLDRSAPSKPRRRRPHLVKRVVRRVAGSVRMLRP